MLLEQVFKKNQSFRLPEDFEFKLIQSLLVEFWIPLQVTVMPRRPSTELVGIADKETVLGVGLGVGLGDGKGVEIGAEIGAESGATELV